MTDHYADLNTGAYLGAFGEGVAPPNGGEIVPAEPPNSNAVWNGTAWIAPLNVPTEVPAWKLYKAMIATYWDATTDPANPQWYDAAPGDTPRGFITIRNEAWNNQGLRDEWEGVAIFYRSPAHPLYWDGLYLSVRALLPSDARADQFLDFLFNKSLAY